MPNTTNRIELAPFNLIYQVSRSLSLGIHSQAASEGIPNTTNRVETAPMNLIYQV